MLVAQGHLAAGQWLLVTGVSSGVGVAALQTGKALGARVIGTSGSADKLARLEKLGLDVGIRTRAADFHDAVMKATDGKGVNLVVNNVGGSVFAECIRASAFEGRLATWGTWIARCSATLDLEALHSKRLTVFGVSNRLRNAAQRAETVRGFVRDVMPRFEDGRSARWSTGSSRSTTCRRPSPSWNPTPRWARSSCACEEPAMTNPSALDRLMLGALVLSVITLAGCGDLVVHDTASLLAPRFVRSEVVGLVAGAGTTFAALPDLIGMLRRRSSKGMHPRMAGISGVFQIGWIYYGLLIASRPVIVWNVVAVVINFLSVAAYLHFARRERNQLAA